MKERIFEFLKAENKSSAQFAEEIGVQPSSISHIMSGRNNPSLDFILKMLEKYTWLSTDWLLFGRGEMYKEKPMQDLFDVSMNNNSNSTGEDVSQLHGEDNSPGKKKLHQVPENEVKILNSTAISRATRIVCFFHDHTFEEYYPSG